MLNIYIAEGLIHISQLKNEHVGMVADVVSRNQKVKVKALKVTDTRISLSMKEVDQDTGEDLNPASVSATGANMMPLGGDTRNPDRFVGNVLNDPSLTASLSLFRPNANDRLALFDPLAQQQQAADALAKPQRRKRLTSPERWELQQMRNASVMAVVCVHTVIVSQQLFCAQTELPDFDEETGVLHNEGESDNEDIEIELVEEEAPFLRGLGRASQELEPVKVVKNPDGSLAQAAMMQSALAKERREIKQETQRKNEQESEVRVILSLTVYNIIVQTQRRVGESINDPMSGAASRLEQQRSLADARARDKDMPEWKKHVTGGGKATYGKRTNLSIIEQRQSLPIYALKDQLIKAIADNQILVVIGETGSGKTTQMTQYLVEAGFAKRGRVSRCIDECCSMTIHSDRLHATASCRRYVGGEACVRGVWYTSRSGGRLYNSFRGLLRTGHDHQVHDRR